MKINPEKIKTDIFEKAVKDLPQLLASYEENDFEKLGKLCKYICQINEYLNRRNRKRLKNEVNVKKYRDYIYPMMCVLVLHNGQKTFAYSRNNIIKYLRGESLHGDSTKNKPKRAMLYDFIFEKDQNIDLEFAVTWSFVIYPGLKSSKSNTDSFTPFRQIIKLENREISVTQIESIALNIIYEYWQILSRNNILWNKVMLTNDLEFFREKFGSDIVEKLIEEEMKIKKWQKKGRIIMN